MTRQVQRFMVGIKGFIIDHEKLLLLKSGNGREELWEVPGGRYDVGEEQLPPETILAREIIEELGEGFLCHIGKPVRTWIRPLGNDFVCLIVYECQYQSGPIHLSNEHTEYQWVTKKDWQRLPLAPGYFDALDFFWKNR